ncbi:hypothetical protein HRM2_08070 [Desulforapulum autotrophicum HRM2]|uniref:Uncharacterized protein n=1 Tax=Desulforapulum autotrophicum (strain ATCC 43914 / DSM 3382 / VKM B-1955 / HRM2) TaxID=177437 RepID=C0QJR7_DESAH|nr:hypothetical protein [Desulforapulum autotrophicum]ACN13920.1 hypothetical protein HRM2_08070 [Desulforapulum autotrophicum HRM2]
MIDYIHINSKILKLLDEANELENVNAFAAKKADAIINALLMGVKPVRAGKLTRNGDARIKRCLKYDLGQGFRLVCVKDGRDFYVLFTGSHDSCDTWMDKHRNLKLSGIMDVMESLKVRPQKDSLSETAYCTKTDDKDDYDDYDDFFERQIPQKVLRTVFQGLVNS